MLTATDCSCVNMDGCALFGAPTAEDGGRSWGPRRSRPALEAEDVNQPRPPGGIVRHCTRGMGSSFTVKNLRDVADMALQGGFSEAQEARFPRVELGAEQTGFNYLIVKPGRREAFAHRHRTAEEIYVVLSGDGHVKLDDELVELKPLDAVRVAPGVARAFEAGPDGLHVLIFGAHVEGDAEMVADFWG
jgi:mannose-6-phosphate isomerase-like protein (cupin superfamily)